MVGDICFLNPSFSLSSDPQDSPRLLSYPQDILGWPLTPLDGQGLLDSQILTCNLGSGLLKNPLDTPVCPWTPLLQATAVTEPV